MTQAISDVVPKGVLRDSLVAIRDRLAAELDDLKWSKHKRECHCTCGITDPRSIVALTKRLEETLTLLASLPEPNKEGSAVDSLIAGAANNNDELASRRANRPPGTAAS